VKINDELPELCEGDKLERERCEFSVHSLSKSVTLGERKRKREEEEEEMGGVEKCLSVSSFLFSFLINNNNGYHLYLLFFPRFF
jgi:hypothetical protein